MTPEEARELLEAATPGPWRAFMATSGQVIVDSGEIDNAGDAPLAAAAPALAELVAGLHYEYAVQNTETGKWVREYGGVFIYTSDPSAADWNTDLEETQNFEEWITDAMRAEHRIVRRLASDPEVVE